MKDNYNRFRYYREKADLTQKEVSFKLGISKNTYVSYELGRNEAPYKVLLTLSDLYGVSINSLISEQKQEEDSNLLALYKELSEAKKASLMDYLRFLIGDKKI